MVSYLCFRERSSRGLPVFPVSESFVKSQISKTARWHEKRTTNLFFFARGSLFPQTFGLPQAPKFQLANRNVLPTAKVENNTIHISKKRIIIKKKMPLRTSMKRYITPIMLLAAMRSSTRTWGRRSLTVAAETAKYKTVKVQVVHRHGDRSPITPMKDVEYWKSQLVDEQTAFKIAENTHVLREVEFSHAAGARGPFGKLSKLGLLQMIRVGDTLSEELTEEKTNGLFYSPLFSTERPLHPSNIRVYSTDFERTIQSVQGLLVGLDRKSVV